MYSTNIGNNRYYIQCIVVSDKIRPTAFVVDTGARFTCCHYTSVDIDIREKDLQMCEIKLLGGFVKGSPVKFYRYGLKQFTVGNIDLGKQNMWVTFDDRVTDTVLGMDILQQVIFAANPYNKKLYFCKDVDDYYNNFKLLTA